LIESTLTLSIIAAQLVHASIKLVGASDGDVYNAYQVLLPGLVAWQQ